MVIVLYVMILPRNWRSYNNYLNLSKKINISVFNKHYYYTTILSILLDYTKMLYKVY